MDELDWEIIFALIGVGENECPWAWSEDWPKGVEEGRATKAVEKLRALAFFEERARLKGEK